MSGGSAAGAGHWRARFDLAANAPAVLLQIYTSAGSLVGPATETVLPGQSFDGIAFEAMAARGGGWLILRDGLVMIQDIANDEGRR
ncbi:MAG: hypothetical protein EON48_13065 [Acetobacteraceae bacterium]|nr:MAG: hypothetical protein EON48_13065 [Acetobacteraceae bacterium]